MRRFRGCQLSCDLKLPNIYEGMIDANMNIPVVSSSLYFWKSVFSFWADSILKSDGDFISKWKFPDCVHAFLWCMSQTSRDRDNGLRVRTHKKNSGETVRRLGTIIQSIFLCPIRSQHLLRFLEIVRWESVPRGFFRTWKLSSRLFSRPDWLPLGLRECKIS